MKYWSTFFSVASLLLILLFIASCHDIKIESIKLIPAIQTNVPPVDGMFWQINPGANPTNIQRSFHAGESFQLGLVISGQSSSVSLSKFGFYHISTKTEHAVPAAEGQHGPFGSGVHIIGEWTVPSINGEYEFRIYDGSKMIASAKFSVS